MTSTEIREKFFDFFRSKGHTVVPSAPIVVKNDPTLMFTNAGMNQFKDIFLGNATSKNKRVADTQKCLRVSGKHNDLEEVGVDTYHHTMFEMLGNWSFGDYFKKEAIEWSWQLLTDVYKIPKDRLYVTVFEGDAKEKLPHDEEAISEWKKWIAPDRIIMGNKKDNFWEMGDTGPCGPCTEIHVDCRTDDERKKVSGESLVNNDHPQVIEIWNNVFIQFNRLKDGSLESLPDKHVDTGMGLERLVRVLQDKQSNYDTDIFTPLISEVADLSNVPYTNSPRSINETKSSIAMRVISDHIRAVSFCIADGQMPSNTGAGYVVRRILRRAVRYGYSYLNFKNPFLHKLVPVLANQFKNVFPELNRQLEFVINVIKEEENSFFRTLAAGITRFNNYATAARTPGSGGYQALEGDTDEVKNQYITDQSKFFNERKKKTVAGNFSFEFFDTYGFPLDLTILMANEIGWVVDTEGFETEMKQQKDRSRAATAIDASDWIILDEMGRNEFVGYDTLESETRVVKHRKVKMKGKEAYQVVLEITPFYAESGGQVGDNGWLEVGGRRMEVFDTKKENDLIIHFIEDLSSELSGEVVAKVDKVKRRMTEIHHSATHLLHAALRNVLGKHVTQKGSLVNEEHLRFDFSHFAKMTDEEIGKVERMINQKIRENLPVQIKEMPKEEALKMGAMALFGEKYGDKVRVVIMDPSYSVELCGGTHIRATGEIGLFKIKSEAAIASGVRRIEAICGELAENYVNEQINALESLKEQLKNPKDISKSVENLLAEYADLKKRLEKFETKQLQTLGEELAKKVVSLNGINFIGEVVEVSHPDALKKIGFNLKSRVKDLVAVLAANIDSKAHVLVMIDDKVVDEKKLQAQNIIKEHVAPLIKGGGGGQKNLATAGGQDVTRLKEVIEKARGLIVK